MERTLIRLGGGATGLVAKGSSLATPGGGGHLPRRERALMTLGASSNRLVDKVGRPAIPGGGVSTPGIVLISRQVEQA